MMKTLALRGAVLLAFALPFGAAAETTVKVGIDGLPLSFGNPYRTAAVPQHFHIVGYFRRPHAAR